jgi:hypothetical protein
MRPVTPTPQDSTLAAVVSYAQQVAPELADRLARAQALVQAGHVEPSLTGVPLWYVRSQDPRQPARFYAVGERRRGPWSCTCPDYERRQDWCKHALAAAIVKRLGSGRPPAPIPFPRPTLDPDAPIPYVLTAKARRALDDDGPWAA